MAIGECGLDYHYDHSPRLLQRRAFAAQLAIAAEMQRPVVVHTRDAEEDTAAMVREAGTAGIGGVLHCFTGGRELALGAVKLGLYVSVSGVISFKKSDALRAIVADIPMDRLLVETDAPYLAPDPFRGRRNEPAYVVHTAAALALLKGVAPEAIHRQTSDNVRRLFAKIPAAAFA